MDLRERPSEPAARHPWEQTRFDFFLRVLQDGGGLAASSVLDVGSGDAWFARQLLARLASGARVTCWDTEYTEQHARSLGANGEPGLSLVAVRPQGRHELVMALDVLEHVQDDLAFLRETVEQNMAGGAHLLMSVPAWPSLYTSHDAALLHYRRYRPQEAASLLRSAGLQLVRSGGLFSALLLPRLVRRGVELVTRPAPPHQAPALAWQHGPALTRLVRSVLSIDSAACRWASSHDRSLPGLSWWAWCRKP